MYKNLETVLDNLGIKKKQLSDELQYEYQKYLTSRLKYNTQFSDKEKDKIFSYLKKNGYSGAMDYLFVFTPYVKTEKEKRSNRLSKIINERMDDLHLTNKQLADLVLVSENTVSNWRNGKVNNLDGMKTYLLLSDALQISTLYLMGDNSYKNEGRYDDRLEIEHINIENICRRILDQIYLFERLIGVSDADFNLIKGAKFRLRDIVNNYLFEQVMTLFERLIDFAKNIDNVTYEDLRIDSKTIDEDEFNFKICAIAIYQELKGENYYGKEE